MLVVIAGDAPRSILFCREKDEEREIWDGFRYGPKARARAFGFDEAHSIAKLDELMPDLLADQPARPLPPRRRPGVGRARDALDERGARARARRRRRAADDQRRARRSSTRCALVKDAAEIAVMRRAAEISARGAPARDARGAARRRRVRDRSRAPARVPPQRRAGAGLHADRRVRRERLRAALRREQRRAAATASCC